MQQRIRQLEGQGMSHARIARELHVSRTTVAELRLEGGFLPSPGRQGGPDVD
jgi:orotate phosphoribosyltransferase-like protein